MKSTAPEKFNLPRRIESSRQCGLAQRRSNRDDRSSLPPMSGFLSFLILILISGVLGCQIPQFWNRQPRVNFPSADGSVNFLSSTRPRSRTLDAQRDGTDSLQRQSQKNGLIGGNQNDESDPLQKKSSDDPLQLPQEDNAEIETEPDSQRRSLRQRMGEPDADSRLSTDVKLLLEDVLESVFGTLPQLQAVLQERAIAQGGLTESFGVYDLNVFGQTVSAPLGFYENYRHAAGVSQNIMATGANVYGGYRIGRGDYPVWYKDRETNEGGEFAVGTTVPLRRNRLIDSRRAAVFRAQQDVAAAVPLIRTEQNFIVRDAKIAYWSWIGAGQMLQTQRRILELALKRAQVIEPLVAKGDLPRLAKIDNDRLIAQRSAKFIEAQRKFEAATIKLSLFLRDDNGRMLLAEEDFLTDFPAMKPVETPQLITDISRALAEHPQIMQLDFEIEKGRIDVAEARNLVLARVDGFAETSQDVGAPSSPTRDKSPLEMQFGLMGELPLQRRMGLGRLTAAQAKLRQLEFKQEFLSNKIKLAVQDSYSAMENAEQRFLQTRENVELSLQAQEIARRQFDAGDIDLIVLNIYEQAVADAEISFIEAELEFFFAEADYVFAMGNF